MYKLINPDYYGFRDEEDGVLVKLEAAAEKELRAEVLFIDPLPRKPFRTMRADFGALCALADVCQHAACRA